MPLRQAALMENPDDHHLLLFDSIEKNVPSLLDPLQIRKECFARATQPRIMSDEVETISQVLKVAFCLLLARPVEGVNKDAFKI